MNFFKSSIFARRTGLATLLVVIFVSGASQAAASPTADEASSSSSVIDETIERDVVIVGGGSTGTYAAVRLREDFGRTVVVVEQQNKLGGHVNTFVDNSTGRGFEAGVQNVGDLPVSRAYLSRLGVAVQPYQRPALTAKFVDFTTGEEVTNYTPPQSQDRVAALNRYVEAVRPYLPLLSPGWENFPTTLPGAPIPEELLMTFREFAERHNLTTGVPGLFAATGFGNRDMLGSLVMWLYRSVNLDLTSGLILTQSPTIVPVTRRNQDIYEAALRLLGPADVMLSTTVTNTDRVSDRINASSPTLALTVRNSATGKTTRILARRLLLAAAPTPAVASALGLEGADNNTGGAAAAATGAAALFARLSHSRSYVGVVSHPALPRNTTIQNLPSAAAPANYLLSVPRPPFATRLDNFVESPYYRVAAVGDESLDADAARRLVQDALDRMLERGTLRYPADYAGPARPPLTWHLFQPHGLVAAHVSRADVEGGFLTRLAALQGRGDTWYTGRLWSDTLSANLWQYTDTVLPKLVAGL